MSVFISFYDGKELNSYEPYESYEQATGILAPHRTAVAAAVTQHAVHKIKPKVTFRMQIKCF